MRAALIALLIVAALPGCRVGPNFKPPNEPVPDQYAGMRATAPPPAPPPVPSQAPQASGDAPSSSFWWREFRDPELDRLVDAAKRGNLDLKSAYLRIAEARIQAQAARSQGLPSLNASASYLRAQLGLAGIVKSQGISPTASPETQAFISSLEKPVNFYQLGFDASWEIDLFGKVRRSVEAADAQSDEAVESRNDLLVSLEAEVAQTYFQLRASQALRRITLDLIAAQREIADLTTNRHLHGLSSEPDVQSARGQLANLESQLPPHEQTIAASSHALAVLTGQSPETLDSEFGEDGQLPALPETVAVGVPSALARRRPDIRNSEAALHAATAEVGVSVASLFPDISLAGSGGLRNLGTGYLFDWQSHFYTFGPTISVPIFHGGALVASVRLSRAQAAEAALGYRKTVLNALQEIEDGLSALHEDGQRTAALKESVIANERAFEVELNAYRHGVISYISALTVQLQAVQARQQLAEGMLTQSTDLVRLYKALGGGWEDAPSVSR